MPGGWMRAPLSRGDLQCSVFGLLSPTVRSTSAFMLFWVSFVMLALCATSTSSFAPGGVLGHEPGRKNVYTSKCGTTCSRHSSESRWIGNARLVSCLRYLRPFCARRDMTSGVRSNIFCQLSPDGMKDQGHECKTFGLKGLHNGPRMPGAQRRDRLQYCMIPIYENLSHLRSVGLIRGALLRLAAQNVLFSTTQFPTEVDAPNSSGVEASQSDVECEYAHLLDQLPNEGKIRIDLSDVGQRLQSLARSLISGMGVGRGIYNAIKSSLPSFLLGHRTLAADETHLTVHRTATHIAKSFTETVAVPPDSSPQLQSSIVNTSGPQSVGENSHSHILKALEARGSFCDKSLLDETGSRRMHLASDEQKTHQRASLAADGESTIHDKMHTESFTAKENCFLRSHLLAPSVEQQGEDTTPATSEDVSFPVTNDDSGSCCTSYTKGSTSLGSSEGNVDAATPEEFPQVDSVSEVQGTRKGTAPGSEHAEGNVSSAVVDNVEGSVQQIDSTSFQTRSQRPSKTKYISDIKNLTQPADCGSKNQEINAECFTSADLSNDVADVLLAALRGPPSKQALAVRTLVAVSLSSGTFKFPNIGGRRTAPGEMQKVEHEGYSCDTSELLDQLLRKGLLATLYRILNMPTSRSFWPRWWQRDAQATLRKHIGMLKCQIECIRLLELVVCLTKDGFSQITANKDLMKVLQRIGGLPAVPSQRENSSLADVRPHEQAMVDELSGHASFYQYPVAHCESRTSPGGTRVLSGISINTERDENQGQCTSQNMSGANLQQQLHTPPYEYQGCPLHTEERPTNLRDRANSVNKQEPPKPSVNHSSPSIHNGKRRNCTEGSHQSLSSAAAPESADSESSGISEKVEFLQAQYVHSLRKQLEQSTSHFLERLTLGLINDISHQNRASTGFTEGPTVEEIDVTARSRLCRPSFLSRQDTLVSTASDANFNESFGSWRKLPRYGKLRAYSKAAYKREFSSIARAKEGKIINSWLGAFVQRMLNVITSLHGRRHESDRTMSTKQTAVIVWIPVNINAGDAALWAAIAAVAGEELANAMKRNFSSFLGEAHSREQVVGMEPLGRASDFVSFLNQVRIDNPGTSDRASSWSFLVVLLKHGKLAEVAEAKGSSSRDRGVSASYGTTAGPPVDDDPNVVLSGTFESGGNETHFRVLSLINGGTALQGHARQLGLKALENAVTSGSAETVTHSLRALTALVSRNPETAADSIMPLLESINSAGTGFVPSELEKALASAIIAPYLSPWYRRVTSEEKVPGVVKDSLQLAALEFLYTVCVHRENSLWRLGRCSAIKSALNNVISVCAASQKSPKNQYNLPVNDYVEKGVTEVERAYDKLFVDVDTLLPPGERHLKVLQEHARPLRLATVVAAALGLQRKWKPRTAGQKGLRILALDGGGTRGVLTVSLLKHIAVAAGKELSEMFDIICGTSTGGIIAVLLGMEKASTAELEMLYDTLIKEIFVKDSAAVAGARLVVRQAYYDERLWESLLERAFSDTRMIDFAADESMPKVFCLSSKISSSPAKVVVWRNYNYPAVNDHTESESSWLGRLKQQLVRRKVAACCKDVRETRTHRYDGSCCVRVRDALRATTAAPGFFIGKTIGKDFFVDGALLANNPAAVAIAEAKALYPGIPIEVVVSVGTGKCAPESVDPNKIGWDGIFNQLVNAATDTEAVHEILNELLPRSVYFRFNPEIETSSIDETSKERLDELKLAARKFFEEEHNKRELQRLAAILQSKGPVERCFRGLSRLLAARTKSPSLLLARVRDGVYSTFRRYALQPFKSTDSGVVRLAKCIVGSMLKSDERSTGVGSELICKGVAETSPNNTSAPNGTASETALSRRVNLDDYSDVVPPEGARGETSGVISASSRRRENSSASLHNKHDGNRRSFWAWLLNSSRSKLASQTRGVFDLLEIHGRRRLSKLRKQQKHETLVPHTGVRHVLHGIFEQMRSGP